MSGFLLDALMQAWAVLGRMAPYLLFGFLMAGVLSVAIPPSWIERHLGGRGARQIVKAAAFGVPMPLCSCSVIPVAASLRRHGASRGAMLAFLTSTPQTGVDNVLVTQGLLGPVFAVFSVVATFISGIACGLAEAFTHRHEPDAPAASERDCPCCSGHGRRGWAARILRYGFVTLPGDIGRAVLLGVLISGVLGAAVPENYFADKLGPGWVSMLLMLLIGIPTYVCSSASVPIALALMRAGISPGAAFVFLFTGPATNAATITTVGRLLGRRSMAVYLATLAACALCAGALMDALGTVRIPEGVAHACEEGPGLFGTVSAVILLALLAPAFLPRRGDKEQPATKKTR